MRALALVVAVGACYSPESRQWTATDAPVTVSLVVTITGPGTVTIADVGTCAMDHCTYTVAASAPRVLSAMPTKEDHPFQQWTMSCTGSEATCSLTPVMDRTEVGAKFE